jgi:hypothetical protein
MFCEPKGQELNNFIYSIFFVNFLTPLGPLGVRPYRFENMYFYDFDLKLLLQHFCKQTQAKRLVFIKKKCIKACLEIEKTQVLCCSHPQNIYFRLTCTNSFHCDRIYETQHMSVFPTTNIIAV